MVQLRFFLKLTEGLGPTLACASISGFSGSPRTTRFRGLSNFSDSLDRHMHPFFAVPAADGEAEEQGIWDVYGPKARVSHTVRTAVGAIHSGETPEQ